MVKLSRWRPAIFAAGLGVLAGCARPAIVREFSRIYEGIEDDRIQQAIYEGKNKESTIERIQNFYHCNNEDALAFYEGQRRVYEAYNNLGKLGQVSDFVTLYINLHKITDSQIKFLEAFDNLENIALKLDPTRKGAYEKLREELLQLD
ncbi:hypothetical protein D6817_03000 [Candidatus Pacearchaeota archaeon]|nr:MAG: hypothetical protein D6817_03000 [Candidatus Pacearchaeota archaeon]